MEERFDQFRRGSRRTTRERSLALVTEARRRLTSPARGVSGGGGGRLWLNGRELGAPDGRFAHLGSSYD